MGGMLTIIEAQRRTEIFLTGQIARPARFLQIPRP
jgi:hypothetical protein